METFLRKCPPAAPALSQSSAGFLSSCLWGLVALWGSACTPTAAEVNVEAGGNFQPGQTNSPLFIRMLSPLLPGNWLYQDRGQYTDIASPVLPVPLTSVEEGDISVL